MSSVIASNWTYVRVITERFLAATPTRKRHRQKYFGALRHPVELLELPPPKKKKRRKDLF